MPVYPTRRDDDRALARELGDLRRQLAAARRVVSSAVDPTPPPADIDPGSLTQFLLEAQR